MNDEKEKWINEVFESVKGKEILKPDEDLFGKIENEIFETEAKVIPIGQWRIAVAAAVLILCFNIVALKELTTGKTQHLSEEGLTELTGGQNLISDYKIYE